MPRHIIVRVSVPLAKLGELVDHVLPPWASMVGYEKLPEMANGLDAAPAGKKRGPKPGTNGISKPKAGTAPAALLRRIRKNPGLRREEIFKPLKKNWPESALSSALYNLRERGLVEQTGSQKEATWNATEGS